MNFSQTDLARIPGTNYHEAGVESDTQPGSGSSHPLPSLLGDPGRWASPNAAGAGFSPQTPHSSGKKYRATFTMPAAFSPLLPAGSSPTPLGAQIGSRGWTLETRPSVQGGGGSLQAQATGSSL